MTGNSTLLLSIADIYYSQTTLLIMHKTNWRIHSHQENKTEIETETETASTCFNLMAIIRISIALESSQVRVVNTEWENLFSGAHVSTKLLTELYKWVSLGGTTSTVSEIQLRKPGCATEIPQDWLLLEECILGEEDWNKILRKSMLVINITWKHLIR